MKLTDNQIWDKAYKGNPSILSDPGVSTPKDKHGWTPLHYLAGAGAGIKEVLKHLDVSKAKNENGNTPLHCLSYYGVKEVWSHPDFNKVKNDDGETPKDWWIKAGHKLPTCTDFT